MAPAGEGLEADHLTVLEPHDRLVGDADLAAVDGPLEVAPDGQPVDGAVVHRRLEQLDAALAVGLGRVHGEVGVAEQLVGRGVRAAPDRDADAGPRVDLAPFDQHRFVQGVEDALGHLDDGGRIRSVLQQDGELVATEPRRGVARAQATAQPVGDGTQQLVAGTVAEAVVDHLEVVEVDEGHRGGGHVVAARAVQRVLDPVARTGPGSTGPVSGSWKAWCRSWSSSVRRPDTSRMVSTTPPTSGSSRRFSPMISAWIDGVVGAHELRFDGPHRFGGRVRRAARGSSARGAARPGARSVERWRRRGRPSGSRALARPRATGSGCARLDRR